MLHCRYDNTSIFARQVLVLATVALLAGLPGQAFACIDDHLHITYKGSIVGANAGGITVGENVSLGLDAHGATISGATWTVNGSAVADFVPTTESSGAETLTGITDSTISFYWYDSTNTSVGVSAYVNGILKSVETAFTVTKPTMTVDISRSQGFVNLGIGASNRISSTAWALCCGADIPPNDYGVDAIITQVSETGTFEWALVKTSSISTWKLQSNPTVTHTESESNVHDGAYNWTGFQYNDSPAQGLDNGSTYKEFTRGGSGGNESFEIYIMFKKNANCIPVPIKVISWGWNGTATWDSGTNKYTGGGSKTGPSVADCSSLPVWGS